MVVNVFVSAVTQGLCTRHELLAWVNSTLQSNLTKIEEMGSGSAYCGMTDFIFPGSIQLKKVKWNSKSEVDWMSNWRILQQAWKQLGIDKPVPVEKLMKAKFQENFEFLQWFRKFFEANYEEPEVKYDPLAARNYEDFPAALPGGNKPARPAPRPAPARTTMAPAARRSVAPTVSTSTPPTSTTTQKPASKVAAQKSVAPNNSNDTAAALAAMEESYKKQMNEICQENALLRESVSVVEKERDFYFSKLRAVEILCTDLGEDAQVEVKRVTQILYETDGVAVGDEETDAHELPTEENLNGNNEEKTNGHSEPEEKETHHDAALVQKAAEVSLDDSETF